MVLQTPDEHGESRTRLCALAAIVASKMGMTSLKGILLYNCGDGVSGTRVAIRGGDSHGVRRAAFGWLLASIPGVLRVAAASGVAGGLGATRSRRWRLRCAADDARA